MRTEELRDLGVVQSLNKVRPMETLDIRAMTKQDKYDDLCDGLQSAMSKFRVDSLKESICARIIHQPKPPVKEREMSKLEKHILPLVSNGIIKYSRMDRLIKKLESTRDVGEKKRILEYEILTYGSYDLETLEEMWAENSGASPYWIKDLYQRLKHLKMVETMSLELTEKLYAKGIVDSRQKDKLIFLLLNQDDYKKSYRILRVLAKLEKINCYSPNVFNEMKDAFLGVEPIFRKVARRLYYGICRRVDCSN